MSLSRTGLDWLLLCCVNATVPVTLAWKHHTGEVSARNVLIIGLVTICSLNVVLIFAARARNGRQGKGISRNLVIGAVVLAILAEASAAVSAYWVPQQNEYLRLALSDVPLDKIHPESEALIVELLRKQLANSKQLETTAREMKPISPPLFSAASFADVKVIRSVSQAYREANEADFSFNDQQQEAMNEFRDKMSKVDPEYLKSFDLAQRDRDEATASTLTLEHECLTATLDLYDYAATHLKDIAVKNGELAFANDRVRRDFSAKLESSKALSDELTAKVQQQVKLQQQVRKAAGFSPP